MRSLITWLSVIPLLALASCSSDTEIKTPSHTVQSVVPVNQANVELNAVEASLHNKRKIVCGSTPPIQDRSKLKANLVKNGVITPEMSQVEADEKVAEFIRKKQQAFEHCR